MTQLLEQAFAAAARLPSEEQDALARALLADLASERLIDDQISGAMGALEALADEAIVEHRAGRTIPLDHEQL